MRQTRAVDGEIDVLLFDLGGVVFDVDFGRCFAHWAGAAGVDAGELAARFAFDDAYAAHERGTIDVAAYFDAVRAALALPLGHDEMLAGWNDIYLGPRPGMLALLAEARSRFAVHAFTNTNAAHHLVWAERFADDLAVFDTIFVSSELGLRKPDREAFETVAGLIGTPPERIVFFDDLAENVAGARAAGLRAVHVTTTDSVRAALAELGGGPGAPGPPA